MLLVSSPHQTYAQTGCKVPRNFVTSEEWAISKSLLDALPAAEKDHLTTMLALPTAAALDSMVGTVSNVIAVSTNVAHASQAHAVVQRHATPHPFTTTPADSVSVSAIDTTVVDGTLVEHTPISHIQLPDTCPISAESYMSIRSRASKSQLAKSWAERAGTPVKPLRTTMKKPCAQAYMRHVVD